MENRFLSQLLSKTVIIVLYFNNENIIEQSIRNLKNLDYSNKVKFLLIDNNSKDNSYKYLLYFSRNWPNMKLMKTEGNLGYAGGMDFGINNSKERFMGLITPDVILPKNWISNSIITLSKNADNATVNIVYSREIKNQINAEIIHGSSFMIKRKNYKEVDGFSPYYFMYYEEIDLSWRLLHANKKLIHIYDSNFIHLGGQSNFSNKNKSYLNRRNRFFTVYKNAFEMKPILYFLIILNEIYIIISSKYKFIKTKNLINIYRQVLVDFNKYKSTIQKERQYIINYKTKNDFRKISFNGYLKLITLNRKHKNLKI